MPLTKELVLQAAVKLADASGIDALSMRKLAQELGVEAMSLYNHVRNKEDVLDGIVDVIVREIDVRPSDTDWKAAMRRQVLAARKVLLRHRWAPRVIESRATASPVMMGYMESVIGILRRGDFSVDLTHHALHVMGSRILGFTQELFDDSAAMEASPEVAAIMAREMADTYPYITEMALQITHGEGLGGCDDDFEFEVGLDLILDGLERLRDAPQTPLEVHAPKPNGLAPPTAIDSDPRVAQAIADMRNALKVLDGAFAQPRRDSRSGRRVAGP